MQGKFERVRSYGRIIAMSVIAVVALSGIATANVWDIVSLFPDTQGGNGIYAKAFSTTAGFRDLTDDPANAFWFVTPAQSGFPYVKKAGNQIWFHPTASDTGKTYGSEWAVLCWTAPKTGNYNISGSFVDVHGSTSCSTTGMIFKSSSVGTPVFSQAISTATPGNFNLNNVSLSQGELLCFAVDAGALSSSDHTGLTCAIVAPEPSSMIALLGALVPAAAFIRRRSK